jgi:hypothetical protein
MIKAILDTLKSLADAFMMAMRELKKTPEEQKAEAERAVDERFERERKSGRPVKK